MTGATEQRHAVSERGAKSASTRIGLPLAEYRARLDAGERWCGRCRQWLAAAAFAPKAGPAGYCRPCVAAYVRDWRRTRRRW